MTRTLHKPRALFITHQSHLSGHGGVQACTQEYLRTLTAAGLDVEIVEVLHDDSLPARVSRRINSSPYFRSIRPDYLRQISAQLAPAAYDFLLFNQVALASAADRLTHALRQPPIKIALSHGCEITDMLHVARIDGGLPLSARLRPFSALALGNALRDEMHARRALDGVVTLSPGDMETERWLGAKHVTWLPRTVDPRPIAWTPKGAVFGYVGTLDHAPNLEGLVKVLATAGCAPPFRLQVVGGPSQTAAWLSSRFAFVDYLGALDEETLREKAGHWRAFIHPIFCPARGCSTKLATALAWGIPVVTTGLGRRGYTWSAGACIEADAPDAFFRAMCSLLDSPTAERARENVQLAAQATPSLPAVAELLRSFLARVHDDGRNPVEPRLVGASS